MGGWCDNKKCELKVSEFKHHAGSHFVKGIFLRGISHGNAVFLCPKCLMRVSDPVILRDQNNLRDLESKDNS